MASDLTLPPKIVSVGTTSQGILLTFNKPMNPSGASDLNNYKVMWVKATSNHTFLSSLGIDRSSVEVRSVRLQSAQYDPATQSVMLIPKHRDFSNIYPGFAIQVQPAKTSVRSRQPKC